MNQRLIADTNREVYAFETEKDPQGFIWDMNRSRRQLRKELLLQNRSYRRNGGILVPTEILNESCRFFSFKKNHVLPCQYSHFQLRDNLKIKNPNEVYVKNRDNVLKYNPINKKSEVVCTPPFSTSTFDVFEQFMIFGGFSGELIMIDFNGDQKFSINVSSDGYSITNCSRFFYDGLLRILTGNNDRHLRIVDPVTQVNLIDIACVSQVNHVSISKDFNQLAACLDANEDYIFDRRTGKMSAKLVGHTDYGFCVDWNPNKEVELATGNQDLSVMIWDTRNVTYPVHILKGAVGAAYHLEYSQNGKYLVSSESRDFLNIYDTGNLKERQVLDYFGEISGFGFDESDQDSLRIFLGISHQEFGSVIELHENSQPSFLI